jgi:hypothetical protein
MQDFRKLLVWQKGQSLALIIDEEAGPFPHQE